MYQLLKRLREFREPKIGLAGSGCLTWRTGSRDWMIQYVGKHNSLRAARGRTTQRCHVNILCNVCLHFHRGDARTSYMALLARSSAGGHCSVFCFSSHSLPPRLLDSPTRAGLNWAASSPFISISPALPFSQCLKLPPSSPRTVTMPLNPRSYPKQRIARLKIRRRSSAVRWSRAENTVSALK